jgi:hypothetical protein
MAKKKVTAKDLKTLCDRCGKWFSAPKGFVPLNDSIQQACEARMSGDRRTAYSALLETQDAIMDIFLEIKTEEMATEEGRAWLANLHGKTRPDPMAAGPEGLDENGRSIPTWICGCQEGTKNPKPGIYHGEQEWHWNFHCPVCNKWVAVQKKEPSIPSPLNGSPDGEEPTPPASV